LDFNLLRKEAQMTRKGRVFLWVCLALAILGRPERAACQESGTLVFDVKNYVSEAKIPAKAKKILEHAGVEWGMEDTTLLIPIVNKRFVKADVPYFTRFGEEKTLQLKPGQYTVTCIGYDFNSMSQDIDKVLSKSAFFNENVLTFAVAPGKTTTLDIAPVFEAESQWRFLTKITMFAPDLKVTVWEDGAKKDEGTINKRTDRSIAWDDYHGPLKF
jgi:hypothetical protein